MKSIINMERKKYFILARLKFRPDKESCKSKLMKPVCFWRGRETRQINRLGKNVNYTKTTTDDKSKIAPFQKNF